MTVILKDWRTVCKLTDAKGRTYNNTQWGPNVTNPCGKLSGDGVLCSGGFYHAYHTPEIAAFMNPAHANIRAPRFWLAEIRGPVHEEGILKLGASEMRTVREIPAITPTHRQRTVFAVCCAWAALEHTDLRIPAWEPWADAVLNHDDAECTAWAASAARAAWAACAARDAWDTWAEWAAWAARDASAASAPASAECTAWAASAAWAARAARDARAAWAARAGVDAILAAAHYALYEDTP